MHKNFQINVGNIHIANSEDGISKTIEELLDLNKLIPERNDDSVGAIVEKNLDKGKYNNKDSRGEVNEVTERQFGKRDKQSDAILEVKLQDAAPSDNGHNPDAWKDKTVNNHKHVAPIWHRVKQQEEDREKLNKDK